MNKTLEDWDELNGKEGELYMPNLDEEEEVEPTEVVVAQPVARISPNKLPVTKPEEAEPHPPADLPQEHELIAQAMLETRGNLAKASRLDTIDHNAMSLRIEVKAHPEIRARYHELLAEELQEHGLHIAERILRMAELQEKAMGQTIMVPGPDGMEEMEIPSDPAMVINLSKEISRLILEGKGQDMSAKSTVILASKEDAKELLASFLNS